MHRLSLLALLISFTPTFAQGFRLPPGFEIVEYADSSLANDIINLTIDPKGRVVVSGKNYIRILVEDKKTGKAASTIEFAKEPATGAHGLLWEGDTLLYVGDGGLRKLVDKDGDDKADGPSTLVRAMKTGMDHGAHHLRRGPDGWLYCIGGDMAGFDEKYAELPTSPIKKPIGGCVIRFHPTSGKSEIVAHGFRNPYGFDFDAFGRLFTYDSDNERCIGMPWYESTRFYEVVEGGFYGWLGQVASPKLWRIPPYSPDTIAPIATFGRGSPTFVVAARQAKEATTSTVLLGDWTFGRVDRILVPKAGKGDANLFLKPDPNNAFAPTAAAIHPLTGDVFVSIGGRGTRGAVYRIRGFTPPLPVRADPITDVASAATDADPLVRRRALEAIARRQPGDKITDDIARAAIEANWQAEDRMLAFAAAKAAAENPMLKFKREGSVRARRTDLLSRVLEGAAVDPVAALPLLASDSDELIVDGLCLLQRRLDLPAEPGKTHEAYTGVVSPEERKTLTPPLLKLLDRLDSGSETARREAARTFAMIAPDEPATKLVAWLKSSRDPIETFHLLACLAHCGPKIADGETTAVADAIVGLDRSYAVLVVPREANWPTRFGELFEMLLKRDPNLGPAIAAHADFGLPEHAALAVTTGFPRDKALPVFLKKLRANREYKLNGKVLALLADLPGDEAIDLVRPHWGKDGLDESFLPFLARKPQVDDREKFVIGLKSLQPKTVLTCLQALVALKTPADDAEILNLLVAWDQFGDSGKQKDVVPAIVARLQTIAKADLPANRASWGDWAAVHRPAVAKRLALVDNVDRAAWQKRLDAVAWARGDVDRGKIVFTKASCAACHSSTQTIGPDLAGVAGRFNRDDLFTAILQPNKEVADRYRITQVVTRDGKVHSGLVVYNAFDGVMLRTSASDSVRIAGSDIESRSVVARSLMPSGLLDAATDRDLADLYAYLRSLEQKK